MPLRWLGWEARHAHRATLLIVHGLSDHAARYTALCSALAASGIATFAFDLRGHGESPGPRGHAPSFATLLDDVERFRQHTLAHTHPDRPVFLLGHSMGGLIALRYVQTGDRALRGVIFSAPWLATATPVPLWKRLPATLLEPILPALPVPAGIEARHISDDPDAVRAYDEDPLVHGRISPRLFREVQRAAREARADHHLRTRSALFLLPSDDRIVDAASTRELAAAITDAEVSVREWAPAGHELLSSTKRADVENVIRTWILERSPR